VLRTVADEQGRSAMGGKADHPGESEAMTALLDAVSGGKPGSESQLLEMVYEELRAIAGAFFKTERPDHTLQPTALVHEAYVKLVRGDHASWENRAHFVAVAAKAMRHVLIDHARAKRTQKRGGLHRVTLTGLSVDEKDNSPDEFDAIDINTQLERLAAIDERQARVVEMRFFADMSPKEIGLVLGVSERTIQMDWRMARAWMRRELQAGAQ
jgi:RNA polymerase sigma factor (TIGR02999 family)